MQGVAGEGLPKTVHPRMHELMQCAVGEGAVTYYKHLKCLGAVRHVAQQMG